MNRDGQLLLAAAGTTILHGDDIFAGPGHAVVVRDAAGDNWQLYHAYEGDFPWLGATPRRVLMLNQLRWRDGWQTVPTLTPSRVAPAPTVADSVGTHWRGSTDDVRPGWQPCLLTHTPLFRSIVLTRIGGADFFQEVVRAAFVTGENLKSRDGTTYRIANNEMSTLSSFWITVTLSS